LLEDKDAEIAGTEGVKIKAAIAVAVTFINEKLNQA